MGDDTLADLHRDYRGRPPWLCLLVLWPLLVMGLSPPAHWLVLLVYAVLTAGLAALVRPVLHLRPGGLRLRDGEGVRRGALVCWAEVTEVREERNALVLVTNERTVAVPRLFRPWREVCDLVTRAVNAAGERRGPAAPATHRAEQLGLAPDEVVQASIGLADVSTLLLLCAAITIGWICCCLGLGLPAIHTLWALLPMVAFATGFVLSLTEDRAVGVEADADGLSLRFLRRVRHVPWSAVTDVKPSLDSGWLVAANGRWICLPAAAGSPAAARLTELCRRAVDLRLITGGLLAGEEVPDTALSRLSGDEASADRGLSLSGEGR